MAARMLEVLWSVSVLGALLAAGSGCSPATHAMGQSLEPQTARAPALPPAPAASAAALPIAAHLGSAIPLGSAPAPSTDMPLSPAATLPALSAPSGLVELDVPEHGTELVSLPVGATSPRPIIVATHGAGGRPEGQCELWRALAADRAFVLCLRGEPTNRLLAPGQRGFYYRGHPTLGVEMTAALSALDARFGPYLDPSAPLYVGFSQGASMGALLLPDHEARFARVALVEGGYGLFQEWNVAVAQRFRDHGGERVLLACGRLKCLEQARQTAHLLERGGLKVRIAYAPSAGHSYRGAMADELRAAFPWLIAGDPRFDPFAPEN